MNTLVIHLIKQLNEGGEKLLSFLGFRGGQKPFLLHVVLWLFRLFDGKKVDFSETIAACYRKVGRCRKIIEIMKVCEY